MIPEADVVNGVPQTAGWFVLNARDAPWFQNELGGYCGFEGRDNAVSSHPGESQAPSLLDAPRNRDADG